MPSFSSLSLSRLASCHWKLRQILDAAILDTDFSVLEGYRTSDAQEDAFRRGHTKLHFPHSKHNKTPSVAVDIAPYPIDWHDTARFARLIGYVERIASEQKIELRFGLDWNRDGRTADETFRDFPHIELLS